MGTGELRGNKSRCQRGIKSRGRAGGRPSPWERAEAKARSEIEGGVQGTATDGEPGAEEATEHLPGPYQASVRGRTAQE